MPGVAATSGSFVGIGTSSFASTGGVGVGSIFTGSGGGTGVGGGTTGSATVCGAAFTGCGATCTNRNRSL
jgi:hypothetical protein